MQQSGPEARESSQSAEAASRLQMGCRIGPDGGVIGAHKCRLARAAARELAENGRELPARHEVRIGWFAAGLVVAAGVLTALAAAGRRGAA